MKKNNNQFSHFLFSLALMLLLIANSEAQITTRVSVDSNGIQGEKESEFPSMSADGRFIVFHSRANNLVPNDTNGEIDIFVHDQLTGETTRVSITSAGDETSGAIWPAISADGNVIAFLAGDDMALEDNNEWNDIFVHDRGTGETSLVSIASDGSQSNRDSHEGGPPALSGDGRFVVFGSEASNLVPNDTNEALDIFVHDRQTKQTIRVNVDSNGNEAEPGSLSHTPSISRDGRFVVFSSNARNLVPDDMDRERSRIDVFVHDIQTSETSRVNLLASGELRDFGVNLDPSISSDGRYITYSNSEGIHVYDQQTGTTNTITSSILGENIYGHPAISGDGRFVVYVKVDLNQDADDLFLREDILVFDLLENKVKQVNSGLNGESLNGNDHGRNFFYGPKISDDGRFVTFDSVASNLVQNDTNEFSDIFVHDLNSGTPLPGNEAELHLASLGVTVQQAKDFIFANVNNPELIFDVALQFNVTTLMLSQITGFSTNVISEFFASFGLDTAKLDI